MMRCFLFLLGELWASWLLLLFCREASCICGSIFFLMQSSILVYIFFWSHRRIIFALATILFFSSVVPIVFFINSENPISFFFISLPLLVFIYPVVLPKTFIFSTPVAEWSRILLALSLSVVFLLLWLRGISG